MSKTREPSWGNEDWEKVVNLGVLMMKPGKSWADMIGGRMWAKSNKLRDAYHSLLVPLGTSPSLEVRMLFPPAWTGGVFRKVGQGKVQALPELAMFSVPPVFFQGT